MSARAALPFASIATLLTTFASLGSAAAGPWNLAPGEYQTGFRAGFFSADSYHDANGNRFPLFEGGLTEERVAMSVSELGWKKRLNVILGVPWASVTRQPGDRFPQRPTATGLADALVGFRYALLRGTPAAAIEIDWKAPLAYERDAFLSHADSVRCGDASGDGDSLDMNCAGQAGTPRLGEGQNDITFALHLGAAVPAMRGFVQASGGYRMRFERPQDQLAGTADLGVWVLRPLLVAGHYEGHVAKQDGPRPTDESDVHRVGPVLLYRVDERIDLIAGSLHTLAAKNALHTDEYFVGVSFRQTKLGRYQGFLGGP